MTPHPDARLIGLCADYKAAVDAFNASTTAENFDGDPDLAAIDAIEAEIDAMEPKTLGGLAALAGVVRWLAESAYRDGSASYSTSFTGDWPERLVRGVLRLAAD